MIADDELMEMLRDLEAAGQNQAVDYMPEWNKANKQALDLRTQIFAAFAELRAERDAALERERVLREALEDMLRLIEEHGDRIMKAHATRIIAARRALAGKEVKP